MGETALAVILAVARFGFVLSFGVFAGAAGGYVIGCA